MGSVWLEGVARDAFGWEGERKGDGFFWGWGGNGGDEGLGDHGGR